MSNQARDALPGLPLSHRGNPCAEDCVLFVRLGGGSSARFGFDRSQQLGNESRTLDNGSLYLEVPSGTGRTKSIDASRLALWIALGEHHHALKRPGSSSWKILHCHAGIWQDG